MNNTYGSDGPIHALARFALPAEGEPCPLQLAQYFVLCARKRLGFATRRYLRQLGDRGTVTITCSDAAAIVTELCREHRAFVRQVADNPRGIQLVEQRFGSSLISALATM